MAGLMEEYGSWIVEAAAGMGIIAVWQWLITSGFAGFAVTVLERMV
ncbi:MAG: hypothetical protein ACI4W2_06865 [Eubacterium sp.]